MISISICIPTYNRGAYLGYLLDSILKQNSPDVEVVISDNASTDETAQVIEQYRPKFQNFRYFRWQENMGADRNFLKVVELATGDYCWLMGSDDVLEPNAIRHLLEVLSQNHPIAGCSVNRVGYKPDMVTPLRERPVAGGVLGKDKIFHQPQDAFSVLGEYFGYLSGQIIQRRLWQDIAESEDLTPYFNAYVHIYVIGRMLQKVPRWAYLHNKLVGWRSGNDSFMAEGRLKRMLIDIHGYDKIGKDLFGTTSTVYRDLNSTVSTVHVRYAILDAKFNKAGISFMIRAWCECFKYYRNLPRFWLRTFPILICPGLFFRLVRILYRVTLKKIYVTSESNASIVSCRP